MKTYVKTGKEPGPLLSTMCHKALKSLHTNNPAGWQFSYTLHLSLGALRITNQGHVCGSR